MSRPPSCEVCHVGRALARRGVLPFQVNHCLGCLLRQGWRAARWVVLPLSLFTGCRDFADWQMEQGAREEVQEYLKRAKVEPSFKIQKVSVRLELMNRDDKVSFTADRASVEKLAHFYKLTHSHPEYEGPSGKTLTDRNVDVFYGLYPYSPNPTITNINIQWDRRSQQGILEITCYPPVLD